MIPPPPCHQCGGKAVLVPAVSVYGDRFRHLGPLWVCENFPSCDSRVGCHPKTHDALGTLAGTETRRLRMEAHRVFDALWKRGMMRRSAAYAWLARELGRAVIHIGESDEETCRRIIQAVNQLTKKPT